MAGDGIDVGGDKQKVDVAMTEFDRGYRECEEWKVSPLYSAIENAIADLMKSIGWKEVGNVVGDLKLALKECDSK